MGFFMVEIEEVTPQLRFYLLPKNEALCRYKTQALRY